VETVYMRVYLYQKEKERISETKIRGSLCEKMA